MRLRDLKPHFILFSLILLFTSTYAQTPTIDSLENLIKQHTKNDTLKVIYLNKAAYGLYQLDINKSLKYAEEAKKLSDELNYKEGKAEALRIIGIYYTLRGNKCKALDYYQKSLKIYEKTNNKKGISKSYNNIGLIYDDLGNINKSIEYYKKSLKIAKEINDKKRISICYSNIGITYKNMGNYSEALKYQNKALMIDKKTGDKARLSRTLGSIAVIYAHNNNYTEALKYFNKSLKISVKAGLKSTYAENYKELGFMYLKQQNFKKARNYSQKAYDIAMGLKETELIRASAKILAKSCEGLGLYKEAYGYYVTFKAMNDSINNTEAFGKVNDIEHEKEKQALELEQQKKDVINNHKEQKQKTIRNYFIAGFIFMLILVVIVLKNYLHKRKANNILAEQKQKIEYANKKLKQLSEFKTGMTSMTVHDLKTLLNKIVNTNIENPTKREYRSIKSAGLQMLNLVMNILDVDKYENAEIKLNIKTVLLSNLINSAIDDVDYLARQKSIVFEKTINEKIEVLADADIVKRIFVNLLTNAIKFSPYNKNIIVKTEIDDNKNAIITVTDFGQGIPPDKTKIVFEKFKQVTAKKSGAVRSTGLGLTFCKLATEAHKGNIGVFSAPNKGTSFWLSLPILNNNNLLLAQVTKEQNGNNNKIILSDKEKRLIEPYINKLKNSSIFAVTDLKEILSEIKKVDTTNISTWIEYIEVCIETYNKEKFKELINSASLTKNSA